MHPSSMENMRRLYRRYVAGTPLERGAHGPVRVLDVGGADVNGSYADLFRPPRFHYLGADLEPGEGVSVVLDDPYTLPLDDGSIDLVLSGQMMEHYEFFWLAFKEMMRVVSPDGYVFVIAPSAGPIRRYPVDCYRFYPDAFHALARYANCEAVEVRHDDRGPWNDLVGVFRRHQVPSPSERSRPVAAAPDPVDDTANSPTNLATNPAAAPVTVDPAARGVRGEGSYLDVLATVHEANAPRGYLEIGVRHGASLALARCPALGIDPAPELRAPLPETVRLWRETSDEAFERVEEAGEDEPGGDDATLPVIDLAFIDGMHRIEFVLRDLMAVERHAHPATLVVIDDIFPAHPAQATRERRTGYWMGDVWKIAHAITAHRPDLFVMTIDVAPGGLMLIGGLDPTSDVLRRAYNPIARTLQVEADPPAAVIEREGSVARDDPRIARMARILSRARETGAPPRALGRMLREALGDGSDSGSSAVPAGTA